jgi:hypothetical protein
VHHADWVALLAPVPAAGDGAAPDMRFLLMPRSQIEIIEDWRSAGLAGSAWDSYSYGEPQSSSR